MGISPNPPTNTIVKPRSSSVQLVHYPGLVPATSDFDRLSNPLSRGNFLNGASNAGDQTTYDYVDVRQSLTRGCANKIEIWIESTLGTEIWITVNPMFVYPTSELVNATHTAYLERSWNVGWPLEKIHRIVVPPGLSATYTIEDQAIVGFNIDYNGAYTGAGTPNVDTLIITLV